MLKHCLKVGSSVTDDVQQDGWQVNSQEVAEESSTQDNKHENSCIVTVINFRHVGVLDVVLGQL